MAYDLQIVPRSGFGEYLRARRELVKPEDVGLQPFGRRRVPGLRREELAMLAGISPDYYLRLEQGRDHRPSAQVVDALARALRLDNDARTHLHVLASPASTPRRHDGAEQAPRSIQRLIATWPLTPAVVQGRMMDVLAANDLAIALSPAYQIGANPVRVVFLDPEARALYRDWEAVAQTATAALRALVGPEIDDPHLAELVNELGERSEDFRRLWARHDVQPGPSRSHSLNHPLVGRLELQPEKLAITGAPGQHLIVFHVAPGSPSEAALTELAARARAARPKDHRQPGDAT
ncbi:MAG: helix-turn-helix transcriptional regulator [Solirubrobacteraceae bacterium]